MCCTDNAKVNAKNIAIFQMVLSSILALLLLLGIIFMSSSDQPLKGSDFEGLDQGDKDLAAMTVKIVLWIYFFACVFSIGFAAVLFSGVQQENKFKLKLWIVFQFVGLILIALDMISNLASGKAGGGALGFALNLYFLYVVNTFYKEVKRGEASGQVIVGHGQLPPMQQFPQHPGQAYEAPPNYDEAGFGYEKKQPTFNPV